MRQTDLRTAAACWYHVGANITPMGGSPTFDMRRRELIILLGAALRLRFLAARRAAQERVRRIGLLMNTLSDGLKLQSTGGDA